MPTLTEIARERKRALRVYRTNISNLRRRVERLESRLRQMVNRRRAIPSTDDYATLVQLTQEVDRATDSAARLLERDIAAIFSL